MLARKKIHFLQLTLVFAALIILVLFDAWSASWGTEPGMPMMTGSMGGMMQSMHARNITIKDLFTQEETTEMSVGMNISHSAGLPVRFSHYFASLTIILLLPFILTGAIFLLIVWLK